MCNGGTTMSYAQFTTLAVAKNNGIAIVTMNQPDKLNAIDETMHRELEQIWRR